MDEKKLQQLESENNRLREALRAVMAHNAEITRQMEQIKDILEEADTAEKAPVTDEAVKNLLKKYSRLT